MIEVQIENFQAIDHLKFQIEGFTAIVGRSNLGKSSIIRALKAALSGADGNNFVRHNPETCARVLRGVKKCQCFCSVQFKFEDGRRLLWEKGDVVNKYTAWDADGEKTVYSNVGGKGSDAPAMLEKGFSQIEIGAKKNLLQVADQFNPLFLLDLSGTVVADVLSDVAQLDEINKAMRLVSKDRRSASSTRKVREEDVKTVEVKLEKYEKLDITLQQTNQVEQSHEYVLLHLGKVDLIAGFLSNYIRVGTALQALKKAVSPAVPEVEPLNSFAVKYSEADRMLGDLEESVTEVRALLGVQKVTVPDIEVVQDTASKLEKASELHKRLTAVAYAVRDLRGVDNVEVPSLPNLGEKADSLKALSRWQTRLDVLESTLGQYEGFDSVVLRSPGVVQMTRDHLSGVSRFLDRQVSLEAVITQTEKELEEAAAEEASILDEFKALGVCPTCSQNITPEGHAH